MKLYLAKFGSMRLMNNDMPTLIFLAFFSNGGRLKINCVVMNGVNTDELADFLDFTRDQELDVRFIEWMPFDDNRWKDAKFFSFQV